LLSLKDAAQQLHLQIATLRDWRQKRAQIEFVKVGGRVCVTQESIDEFIKANTLTPLPAGAKQPNPQADAMFEDPQALPSPASQSKGQRS